MNILNNKPFYPYMYVEAVTNNYYRNVSTEEEFKRLCVGVLKRVPNMYKLTDAAKVSNDISCVVVTFSTPEDYNDQVLRMVRVPKVWERALQKYIWENKM